MTRAPYDWAMHPSGSSIRLTACLAASLLLHAGVLWPAMARVVESPPPDGVAEPPPAVPPPPPVEIGIERSEAPTTTWIGYEEYREHLARLAEVEQAAFTTAAGGGGGPAAEAAGEGGRPEAGIAVAMAADRAAESEPPVPAEVPPREPREASATAVADAASDTPETSAESAARPILDIAAAGPAGRDRPSLADAVSGESGPAVEPADGGMPEPTAVPAEAGQELEQVLDRVRETLASLAAATAAPAAGGRGGREQRSTPPASEPADATEPPGETPPREGVVSDRQSPATSRIDVPRDRLRPDRPIAREGLEVRPREPEFWTIERLTAVPRNPVVLIRFGRDGVPTEARLLEATGDARFDQAILASLYRWRASGRKLTDLPADGSLDLEFRIVIIGR